MDIPKPHPRYTAVTSNIDKLYDLNKLVIEYDNTNGYLTVMASLDKNKQVLKHVFNDKHDGFGLDVKKFIKKLFYDPKTDKLVLNEFMFGADLSSFTLCLTDDAGYTIEYINTNGIKARMFGTRQNLLLSKSIRSMLNLIYSKHHIDLRRFEYNLKVMQAKPLNYNSIDLQLRWGEIQQYVKNNYQPGTNLLVYFNNKSLLLHVNYLPVDINEFIDTMSF